MSAEQTCPNGSSAEAGPVVPFPPRYWWLKRILITTTIVVLSLVALRIWWGWVAHRRLQAEIDKYVAAGEPIYPEDFDSEWVPDEENAAKFLLDAAAALDLSTDDEELIREVAYGQTSAGARLDEVSVILNRNQRALDLMRRARAAPRIDWAVRIRTPAFQYRLPSLSDQRQLTRLLCVNAAWAGAGGRDSTMLEALRVSLAQSRIIDALPTVITQLVVIANDHMICRSIELLVPGLGVRQDGSSSFSLADWPVRALVEKLIAELLEEKRSYAALVRAIYCDRMFRLDFLDSILNGLVGGAGWFSTVWNKPLQYILSPILQLRTRDALKDLTSAVEAAGQRNWVAAKAALPIERPDGDSMILFYIFDTRSQVPSIAAMIAQHFYASAMRRMAATALAMRLYEVDHNERPEQLQQLVPAYLSAIPLDPFAENGRPIGYRPQQADPLLYCIGQNGVDDGGSFALSATGIDRKSLDVPFFLDGEPRRGTGLPTEVNPRSPETGDNENDERYRQRDPD